MRGLQGVGAAYAGFGGHQWLHRRSGERTFVLGRPYDTQEKGQLQPLFYVDGIVGGEVSLVRAPMP